MLINIILPTVDLTISFIKTLILRVGSNYFRYVGYEDFIQPLNK